MQELIDSSLEKLNTFRLAKEKSISIFGFPFKEKEQVLSLIALLDDNQVPRSKRSYQGIQKINRILSNTKQFSDPQLKAILNNVKEDLIECHYQKRIFTYRHK